MHRLFVLVLVAATVVAGLLPGGAPAQSDATASPGAATPTVAPGPPAWLQLGPSGALLARAVTTDPACPEIALDGAAAPMPPRAQPDAPAFPVLVCEAPVPPGTATVAVAGRPLPLPPAQPRRIAVIGDTGCRLNAYDGFQACNDPQQWPFARIAQRVAAWQPDLVIHVGDYLYREQACPAGNAGCAGSPFGDTWAAWDADFFAPAAPLLAAAPWLFLRGNHETCDRAGDGWFRLLDPAPLPTACPEFTDPYAVPLGPLQLLVVDSASAGDETSPPAETAAYRAQFAEIARLARENAWLVTHKPVWGVIEDHSGAQIEVRDESFEAATRDALPAGVELVLSGHIHLAEVLLFDPASGRPPQLVVGNGGTALDRNVTAELTGRALDDAALSSGETLEQFGFLTLEAADDAWLATVRDTAGHPLETCTLKGRAATCAA